MFNDTQEYITHIPLDFTYFKTFQAKSIVSISNSVGFWSVTNSKSSLVIIFVSLSCTKSPPVICLTICLFVNFGMIFNFRIRKFDKIRI